MKSILLRDFFFPRRKLPLFIPVQAHQNLELAQSLIFCSNDGLFSSLKTHLERRNFTSDKKTVCFLHIIDLHGREPRPGMAGCRNVQRVPLPPDLSLSLRTPSGLPASCQAFHAMLAGLFWSRQKKTNFFPPLMFQARKEEQKNTSQLACSSIMSRYCCRRVS